MQAVGHQKCPSRGNRNVAHGQRLKLDQGRAAFARGQRRGVVHAAAAGADELLAIGQDLHQLFEGGLAAGWRAAGQGESHDQGGRRRESGGRRQVGFDGGVDAVHDSPFAGDGLGGGAQIILPIAARDGLEAGSPVKFAVSVGFAGGARCGNRRAVGSATRMERRNAMGSTGRP